MLWTTIRKARNYCQDVDNCGDKDHCRAGGSARVAKVLAFASFGLQILESDMSCNCSLHELLCILLIMSCNVWFVMNCVNNIQFLYYINLLVFDVHKEHTDSLDLKAVAK